MALTVLFLIAAVQQMGAAAADPGSDHSRQVPIRVLYGSLLCSAHHLGDSSRDRRLGILTDAVLLFRTGMVLASFLRFLWFASFPVGLGSVVFPLLSLRARQFLASRFGELLTGLDLLQDILSENLLQFPVKLLFEGLVEDAFGSESLVHGFANLRHDCGDCLLPV